jgi:DNA-directed RNA polymerase
LPTPAEIDEQVALEREQIRRGLEQLRANVHKLEQQEYASAAVYGAASIQDCIPVFTEHIQNSTQRIKKGRAGTAFKDIHKYLQDLDAEVAAAITLKVVFDKVFAANKKSQSVASVVECVGRAIENECMMSYYEEHIPALFETIKKNHFHRSSGTHQKVKTMTTLMHKFDVDHWKPWGVLVCARLGTWFVDKLCESSQWFHRVNERQGRKTIAYLRPTEVFIERKDSIMEWAEMFSPITWPMLIEPLDWSNDFTDGGYVLNQVMKGHSMVRRGNPLPIQGRKPIEFLNKIQKVAYKLNPFIVDVAETLTEKGIAVGKFVPVVELPLPPKPVDIATNYDARKKYRQQAAEVCNINAQAFIKSCRTRMTMNAVKVFKQKPRFYIPWSFDYRGRVYPIPSFLTPQCTDFGKSLLSFAEPAEVTPQAEMWLAFAVSTCYGNDKDSMVDRLTWTDENHDLITRVATDPIGNLSEWEAADEPWQFLSACDEYYHCCIARDRESTAYMLAIDATCSGLQILAGLARDANTAKLVNVLPSSKPQDAYQVIADEARPDVPDTIKPHMCRRVSKRTVMTVPYNAKPFSNRGYIRDALKEKGVEITKEELTETVSAVRKAMNKVVPGPMRVMKWIESEVGKAIDRGETELVWVTPSGFRVTQRLMKKNTRLIDLQLLGRCQIKMATGETDQVDRAHHKNATAPNLIHSLDASLLCMSTLKFDQPIALIHDSVLCRAPDMTLLSTLVRETYMDLFAGHDYLKTFAAAIGAETEPPIIGDLDPSYVIGSNYFFC